MFKHTNGTEEYFVQKTREEDSLAVVIKTFLWPKDQPKGGSVRTPVPISF